MGLAFLMPEWTAKSFVGVGWITADNFRGKQTYSTGDVYVYTGTLHPTAPQAPSFAASQGINAAPAPPPLDVPVMAMIAVDSRLPLIVEKGSQVITYSYQAPPVQMLEIPPEFQKPLSGLQTRLNFIEQLRNLH